MVKDKLSQFLLNSASKHFKLGEWDCGLMLADWYVFATGKPDPAASFRGTEYSMDSVLDIVSTVAKDLALPETKFPKRGDVGIISIEDKTKGSKVLFGAIFAGSRWILLAQTGISGISPNSVALNKAWRVVVN